LRGVVHEDPLLSERCTPHCSCVLSTQQCAHKAPSAQQQSLWPVLPRTCNLGSRTTVGAVGMMGAVGAGGRWADRLQPALREQWHTHHSPYAPNPHHPPPRDLCFVQAQLCGNTAALAPPAAAGVSGSNRPSEVC
jgi:hypothetical protein